MLQELTRRDRKKNETKDRIFQAAFDLFKRRGVEATTVEEICHKADVAKGTFFNYFPRKEAVFGYVAEIWFAEAEDKVDAILAQPGPLRAQLIDMFAEFAGFYEQEPGLGKYVAYEWLRNQHTGQDETCMQWDALGRRVVRHEQASGEIRDDVDAGRIHEVIHAVYQGTILQFLGCPTAPFPLRDELRRRLGLLFEGLAPRGGE